MRSSLLRRLSGHRGRTALFVAVTAGAMCAAAFIVPAVARGRANPDLTVAGQTQFVDNVDSYAVQGVVGGQNNATAIEGFVTNASATFDNAVFGYTVAPSGNAVIGIAQPSSGTATALVGYSYRGYGVIGQTPYTGATVAGVLGQDLSGTSTSNAGVTGTTTSGYGVTGTASGNIGYGGNFEATGAGGYGLYATSSQSYGAYVSSATSPGVYAYTTHDSNGSSATYGVEGVDSTFDTSGTANSGVFGYSTYGTGMTGQSGASGGTVNAGPGVVGITNNDSATVHNAFNAVEGFDNDPYAGSFDSGVYGSTGNGYGVKALSNTYIGLYAQSNGYIAGDFVSTAAGEEPILGSNTASTTSSQAMFVLNSGNGNIFSVAADGTTIASGSIFTGSPLIATRTLNGTEDVAFGARETRPTIEDVGEANLVNGSVYVPIDSQFRSTIDPIASYLVFVTPQGDTQGLYVTGKTHTGFYVREHGGSSNIAFDYRIVAKPAYVNEARLPDVRTMPQLAMPRLAKVQSPAEVTARDQRMRAGLLARTLSASQVAQNRATEKFNAARAAAQRRIKFPRVPTPAELHVPGTTPH